MPVIVVGAARRGAGTAGEKSRRARVNVQPVPGEVIVLDLVLETIIVLVLDDVADV